MSKMQEQLDQLQDQNNKQQQQIKELQGIVKQLQQSQEKVKNEIVQEILQQQNKEWQQQNKEWQQQNIKQEQESRQRQQEWQRDWEQQNEKIKKQQEEYERKRKRVEKQTYNWRCSYDEPIFEIPLPNGEIPEGFPESAEEICKLEKTEVQYWLDKYSIEYNEEEDIKELLIKFLFEVGFMNRSICEGFFEQKKQKTLEQMFKQQQQSSQDIQKQL